MKLPGKTNRSGWLTAAMVVLAFYLAYLITGFLLLPPLLRPQIERQLTQLLERPVALETLRINPIRLSATARGFHLLDEDGVSMADFEELYLNLRLWPFVRKEISIQEFRLHGLELFPSRDADGIINFLALLPKSAPQQQRQGENPPTRPWHFSVDNLEISAPLVRLEDRVPQSSFALDLVDITIQATSISTRPDHGVGEFSAVVSIGSDEGKVATSGHIEGGIKGISGDVFLTQVNLVAGQPYFAGFFDARLTGGMLGGGVSYSITREDSLWVEISMDQENIQVESLVISGMEPEATSWVQLDRLVVSGLHVSSRDQHIRLGFLELSAPQGRILRDTSGSLYPVTLFRKGEPMDVGTTSKKEATAAPSWSFHLENLLVRDGRIHLNDQFPEVEASLGVEDVYLSIRDVFYPLEGQSTFETSLHTIDGGTVSLGGVLNWEEFALTTDVRVKEVPLMSANPYLALVLPLRLESGLLSIEGGLIASLDDNRAPAADWNGRVSLTNLFLQDTFADEKLFSFTEMVMDEMSASWPQSKVAISEIHLDRPFGRFVIFEDGQTNLSLLLPARTNPAEGTANTETTVAIGQTQEDEPRRPASDADPTPRPAVSIEIGTVLIEDGTAFFADFAMQPSFSTGLGSLSGSIESLGTDPSRHAVVNLTGQVDVLSPVRIQGEVNPFAGDLFVRMEMDFSNIELTTFSAYSARFAGHPIERGKLSVQLRYHVEEGRLEANHKVVVDQLTLGPRVDSPEATSLPVRLAVALLKDSRGVINLELPVTGSLDDPRFSVGGVVMRALGNLITRLVTSPFAAIGAVFRGGPSIDRIPFDPGSASLEAAALERLQTLARALSNRPELRLEITGRAHAGADHRAISRNRLNEYLSSIPLPPDWSEGGAVEEREVRLRAAYMEWFGEELEHEAGMEPSFGETGVRGEENTTQDRLDPGLLVRLASWLGLARMESEQTTAAAQETETGSGTEPPSVYRWPSVDSMEERLLARMLVSDDEIFQLARGRAAAVQEHLALQENLPAERLFLRTVQVLPRDVGTETDTIFQLDVR